MIIIILNVLSLIAFAIYTFFFVYAYGMGQAYNTGSGATITETTNSSLVLFSGKMMAEAVLILGPLTLLSLTAYFIPNKKLAFIVAIMPLLLVVLLSSAYYVYDLVESKQDAAIMAPIMAKRKEEEVRVYNQTPKSYISTNQPSFLTVDQEFGVINFIFVEEYFADETTSEFSYRITNAVPLGRINGKNLELYSKEYLSEENALGFIVKGLMDKENKTIFDNYTVIYKDGQNSADYHLEKYTPLPEVNISN